MVLERKGMLTTYVQRMMARASYSIKGSGTFSGELEELGIEVQASHLEEARAMLQEALERKVVEMLLSGTLPPGMQLDPLDPLRDRLGKLTRELWKVFEELSRGGLKPQGREVAGEASAEAEASRLQEGKPSEEAQPRQEQPQAKPSAIEEWLRKKRIQLVKTYQEDEDKEKVLNRLALYLGDRFSSLERLYEKLKQSLSLKRQFTLDLSEASQEEISNSTQFCTLLKQYAMLTSYHYSSESRTIRAKASTAGWVQNFLSGLWLERYVAEKAKKLLRTHRVPHEAAMGCQLTMQNGDAMELDVLIYAGGRYFWIETKTGEFQEHIDKYSKLKKVLGLSPRESFLVVLGMDRVRARELSALYEITVTNHQDFLDAFAEAMGLPRPQPQPAEQPSERTENGRGADAPSPREEELRAAEQPPEGGEAAIPSIEGQA